MKRVLADIQGGKFARDWMLENKVNQTSFKATRAKLAEHPIEEVGAKLRDMMPWIKKGALVDKIEELSAVVGWAKRSVPALARAAIDGGHGADPRLCPLLRVAANAALFFCRYAATAAIGCFSIRLCSCQNRTVRWAVSSDSRR